MLPSGADKYIVQAHCSLSYYPEFCMLRAETARTLGDWIYEDICKGNLTNLRRILHLSLAKGNPKRTL
jgi:hypothetical protein